MLEVAMKVDEIPCPVKFPWRMLSQTLVKYTALFVSFDQVVQRLPFEGAYFLRPSLLSLIATSV